MKNHAKKRSCQGEQEAEEGRAKLTPRIEDAKGEVRTDSRIHAEASWSGLLRLSLAKLV